eukprot:6834417-Pyramimonas_sp.AAC.1
MYLDKPLISPRLFGRCCLPGSTLAGVDRPSGMGGGTAGALGGAQIAGHLPGKDPLQTPSRPPPDPVRPSGAARLPR